MYYMEYQEGLLGEERAHGEKLKEVCLFIVYTLER